MLIQMIHHPGNCLNHKKPYAQPCRLCVEACPHRAISAGMEINARACTECGACMAVCPSDGMVDHTVDAFYTYLAGADEINLHCPLAVQAGFEVPCLGLFDRDTWTGLMVLAEEKPVKIFTGVCSECEDKAACAQSVKLFNTLHAEWPEHEPLKIIVKPDNGIESLPQPTEPEVRPIGLRARGKEKLEELLPGLKRDETYNIPRARTWLRELLNQRPHTRFPFSTLLVDESCTSCGVCALICPQGALSKREENGKLKLVFEPYQCVQCGRCVETCRPQALKFTVKMISPRLFSGKIRLHEGSSRYCSRCGKQIFDHSELCIACASAGPEKQNFFL
ncbi:4Fe-4S binding protein [Paradesulfitobacterium ferrireducens]|uniref:4Fe-4S binding protein n=1 Tax=Paradesulfitobacterium ferrireducens TaxID=2816476 RepID=UPI001A90700A|nr:4Fe-4S binding protein [Paradesulfitobacterium ferrireducens]